VAGCITERRLCGGQKQHVVQLNIYDAIIKLAVDDPLFVTPEPLNLVAIDDRPVSAFTVDHVQVANTRVLLDGTIVHVYCSTSKETTISTLQVFAHLSFMNFSMLVS